MACSKKKLNPLSEGIVKQFIQNKNKLIKADKRQTNLKEGELTFPRTLSAKLSVVVFDFALDLAIDLSAVPFCFGLVILYVMDQN